MNLDTTVQPIRCGVLPIFFVIDTSGCAYAYEKNAISMEIEEIRDLSKDEMYEIKIAILEFSSSTRWITNGLIEFEKFNWYNYDSPADFGAACKALNDKLSRTAFMQDTHSFAPIIILTSQGIPNDDWKRPLIELRNNEWFAKAIKVAVAIGEDANIDLLAEFTGSKDAVIKFQPNIICLLIKEAVNSIWISLDLPISREEDDENELQTIFNSNIKRNQKINQDSSETKDGLNNKSTNQWDDDW